MELTTRNSYLGATHLLQRGGGSSGGGGGDNSVAVHACSEDAPG